MWAYAIFTAPLNEELQAAAERHRVLADRREQIVVRRQRRRRIDRRPKN